MTKATDADIKKILYRVAKRARQAKVYADQLEQRIDDGDEAACYEMLAIWNEIAADAEGLVRAIQGNDAKVIPLRKDIAR